ncbi:MAG: hypothetical protein NXI23_17010 [Bacteroidetes bacterium]|nr:hypothetical protein [Bacteroidota bacterium]
MPQTEATLSWDVSGYYFYLPAFLIYKDAKKLEFKDEIIKKYHPTWSFLQAFQHEQSGNYVMKYSSGMAIQYLPFFGIAHLVASSSDAFEADGFSLPYQMAISLGSLLIAFIGLWFLRKILFKYFEEWPTAITIFCIVFGTNYLDYAAINGAMAHNYLFTLYALLIWQTIQFYEKPTYKKAFFVGGLLGLMALTRPTEILACLIPILWINKTSEFGFNEGVRSIFANRLQVLKTHYPKYLIATFLTLTIGSIQLIYWKYATGNWIVYSYQDQGFSWLSPHLLEGLFSYKSGWLIYSPMMIFSLVGFYFLFKKRQSIFGVTFLFSLAFIYITFAWNEWLYGGGLGIRAMVQSYVVLAFPFCAFLSWMLNKAFLKWILGSVLILFCFYNLWWTHQAHEGALLKQGVMTKAYFWRILGTFKPGIDAQKLLDTDEAFTGERKQIKVIYEDDFESDTIIMNSKLAPISGQKSICLNKENQFSPSFNVSLLGSQKGWVRVNFDCRIGEKEHTTWKMTQTVVKLKQGEKTVKERLIRLQRLLFDGQTRTIYFDVEIPDPTVDNVEIYFWNSEGKRPILIDNLKIETFTD